MSPFEEMLASKIAQGKHLCVGLDPVEARLPPGVDSEEFVVGIVEACSEVAATFKPNLAFYGSRGIPGWEEFLVLRKAINDQDFGMPVINDGKRGDIAATNEEYVKELWEFLQGDAATLNPYLGNGAALDVFLADRDRFGFVLCRTTNPGAKDLQDRLVFLTGDEMIPGFEQKIPGQQLVPLYQLVGYLATTVWNPNNNVGLVTGATYPEELANVRRLVPTAPLLIPGIGKQAGSLELSVAAAYNPEIPVDFVINVSSAIVDAWKSEQFAADPKDFAKAAGEAAIYWHDQIQEAIEQVKADLGNSA